MRNQRLFPHQRLHWIVWRGTVQLGGIVIQSHNPAPDFDASARIVLQADATLDTVFTDSTLTIGGTITDNGSGFSLDILGPGTVVLTGTGSSLTINNELALGSLFINPSIPDRHADHPGRWQGLRRERLYRRWHSDGDRGWLGLDKQWRSRCDRVVPQTTGPCRCILRSLTSSAAFASFYFGALQSVRHISRSPEANRENIELANFHESPRPVGPTPGNIQISPSYESSWHQLSFP
jgi:hypothetical protein